MSATLPSELVGSVVEHLPAIAAGAAECLPSPPEVFDDGLPAAIHR